MNTTKNSIDSVSPIWKEKAVAFVIRAQRELWGKRNEDIMVWFYENGFKNQFIKDLLIGWNRHSKVRSAESWSLDQSITEAGLAPGKLLFPEGLVIPYIVDKNLKKVTIFKHNSDSPDKTHVIMGSCQVSMILGDKKKTVAVVEDIMDGLYLHQEAGEKLCVMIPHKLDTSPDPAANKLLGKAESILFCCKESSDKGISSPEHWADVCNRSTLIKYTDRDKILDRVKRSL